MDKKTADQVFELLKNQNPQPRSELSYGNPFELMIAVMLSAQATDKSVNKVTPHLFNLAKTPREFLQLGIDKLKQGIKTIGLYNAKAVNILKTCEILVRDYESQVPDNREALEKLPGIGRKTANVILNVAFNQPTIAVDTHVFRVANRTGLAPGKTPLAVEKGLEEIVAKPYKQEAHHWLILHGRYTCVARKPKCDICLIRHLCEYGDKQI